MSTMTADVKNRTENQNVSVCAADKWPGTKGLSFTVEKIPWWGMVGEVS